MITFGFFFFSIFSIFSFCFAYFLFFAYVAGIVDYSTVLGAIFVLVSIFRLVVFNVFLF